MEENRLDDLSPRERECLLLVGQGKAGGSIANALGISENTVNGYIASGMAKLGSATRREAGYLVLEHARGSPRFDAGINLRVAEPHLSSAFEPQRFSDDDVGSDAAANREAGSPEDADIGLGPLKTLAMVAVILAALLIVILALKPIIQSARDLAGVIQPGRSH